MASLSGINEHNMARRKENFLIKKAHYQKQMAQALKEREKSVQTHYLNEGSNHNMYGSSHPDNVDQQRREECAKQQYSSAKICHRFNSIDYLKQW